MFKRFVITLIAVINLSTAVQAQELNARVQILSPQIQNTNKRVLDVLETSIRDFLNTRRWSPDNFQVQERIDCNFVINITEWDGGANFRADAQIQSTRPVYGTTFNSTVFNYSDKEFSFNYTEGQPLDFSDQNYINNLSSLLAFYANIIVGLDYDTFSRYGGSPLFAKAQTIVNNAQNAPFPGWKAFENLRNRYWLAENLTNKAYNPIREVLYNYHRHGLDIMYDNQSKGRKEIMSLLPQLQKIDKQKQGSMLSQIFFTSKADELVNLLSQSDPRDRMNAYNILTVLDPPNVTKYEVLKNTRR
ncbi:DUF4835 family protein [Paradesertivirga mongoliensis]|uniref:DUF4835 family protein n=1 Tax=Paradesertivirga mongoliensis TaxID=2100740 RepID=A0ABW4ZGD0_9SPHI|nr:DUF4835 family protein [Pedobacter mongoliensis]